jgi:sugar phosphate isomerase/epimerase
MVALKDFVWEKSGGQWRTRWVPLGEGMVRWPEFFQLLARVPFPGPLSVHIEYDPGGSNKADRFEKSFLAAERDLAFLRQQLKTAGLAS